MYGLFVQGGKELFMNHTSRKRILIGLVAALAGLALLISFAPGLWLFRLRPVAREKVIALLEKRFDDVRLEKLELRLVPGLALFPRLAAVGEGLSVSLPGRAAEGVPPFVTMTKFEVEVGLLGILRTPFASRVYAWTSSPSRFRRSGTTPSPVRSRASPGLRHRGSRCGRGDSVESFHATPRRNPFNST